ncbi:adenylate/guanylate cyclase domain-containing protein [Rhizobium sp. KVB221]|uniref:Adenylate/guanylate cyclase domain-containing protein n=1 Tax=Rhizobium setariae TaxID=2801340 RepID=A0A937CRI5_9HYPH|nr:adenylate/guanylate cyclase domain-containing protein [Rhizobium setariae]MBL0374602.1 adenylate/guanylate cyclase domain-containing protein [Rhizobium setariae]
MEPTANSHALICRGCWDQMHMPIPIRGPLSIPFRVCGIARSKMNPNICTICERSFQYVKKQRRITATATILFADIRGYTRLSERIDPVILSEIVSIFQDQCAQAIWAHDGIVNKQMGDGLMAIFNFPIKIVRHADAAISAAMDIQRRCARALNNLTSRFDEPLIEALGVGVGVHTGQVEIGEFSTFRSDFTAIGGTVNLAARLESLAAAKEILVSQEAAAAAPDMMSGADLRMLTPKGIDHAVPAHVLITRD